MAQERVAALRTIKPRIAGDGSVVELTLTAGDNETFRFAVRRQNLPELAALILDTWTRAGKAGQRKRAESATSRPSPAPTQGG